MNCGGAGLLVGSGPFGDNGCEDFTCAFNLLSCGREVQGQKAMVLGFSFHVRKWYFYQVTLQCVVQPWRLAVGNSCLVAVLLLRMHWQAHVFRWL